MTNLWRTRFIWTGWAGGPGYTTFYGNGALPAQGFATAAANFMVAATFLTGGGGSLPNLVTISQENFLTLINDANGQEQSQSTINIGGLIVGTDTRPYAAPAGATVTWNTVNFINGRRLRGRTYMVPTGAAAYQADGTLDSAYRTQLLSAANSFIGSSNPPFVWHRPTATGASDGSSSGALTAQVTDRVAVLRSRRA